MFWLLANQEFYINWKACLVVVTVIIIDLVFVCLSTSIANIYLKKKSLFIPNLHLKDTNEDIKPANAKKSCELLCLKVAE